jgi:hypothetical protein
MEFEMTDTTITVTRQALAAYRAHRTMLVKSLDGSPKPTRAVRKAIKWKIAGYDALLADLTVAA